MQPADLTNLIGGIQLVVTGAGLAFTYHQVRLLVKTHQENHDWNRRSSAQEAIIDFRRKNKTKELKISLKEIDINDGIPLQVILSRFETEHELESYINETLNTFEGYSRGVFQGIYDEQVIKAAVKGTMIRYHTCFYNYIIHLRKTRNPDLFKDLEVIVRKWNNEDNQVAYREKTG